MAAVSGDCRHLIGTAGAAGGRRALWRRLLHNAWLDSGDLGSMAGRELFVTGRAKDVIILAGRHFYPQEIEDTISAIEGIRKGCVAVFGGIDAQAFDRGSSISAARLRTRSFSFHRTRC